MNKRRVVPAQPGFDLIMPHRTERSGFECHPIVAWKIVLLGENATTTIPVVGSHRVATYRAGTGIVKYRRPVSDHANITASATMSRTIAIKSANPLSLIVHMAPAAYGPVASVNSHHTRPAGRSTPAIPLREIPLATRGRRERDPAHSSGP